MQKAVAIQLFYLSLLLNFTIKHTIYKEKYVTFFLKQVDFAPVI